MKPKKSPKLTKEEIEKLADEQVERIVEIGIRLLPRFKAAPKTR